MFAPWKENCDKPRQHIKKQRDITLLTEVHIVKAMVLPVVMYGYEELDYKEGCALKNWCFQTVILEKTLENPLDSKEIKPVNPKRKSTLNIHWKEFCWRWSSSTLAIWCEEWIHRKIPWFWERLRAVREGSDRIKWLDGIIDSRDMSVRKLREIVKGSQKESDWLSNWTETTTWHDNLPLVRDLLGKPGMLQSMGLQRVGHDWATELNWEIFS